MAANKYLAVVAGKHKEVFPSVTSTPNAIVAADSTGRIDASLMPVGVGAEVVIALTSEAISAGAFVNLYSNAGVLNARNADCTTNGKKAHGFVLAAVTSGGSATVFTVSQANTQLTGLVAGSDYFLSTIGSVSLTAPSTAGNLVQQLGVAGSTTSLVFCNLITIEIA